MREFKFRIWSVSKEKMYPLDNFTCNFIRNLKLGTSQIIIRKADILMQYIGFKDKNEKEIYEGDIVSGGDYNGSIQLGIITYYNNSFIALPFKRFSEGYSEDFKNFEVIGNIYENPELIKQY